MAAAAWKSGHAHGVELVCKHGHPVTKFKKLRPWQGHVKDRACSQCARPIDRKAFRWRCSHSCDWELCEACYSAHWRSVVRKAARAPDRGARLELLEAVPESRRPRRDDPLFSPCTQATMATPKRAAEVGVPVLIEVRRSVAATALFFALAAAAWALAAGSYSRGSAALLSGGDSALFPDPWLLSGFAHIGGAALCKAIACALRYDAAKDSEAVDTMSSTVLGAMLGVESGLYTKVLCSMAAESRHDIYVLRPLVLAAAGVLSGTVTSTTRVAVSGAAVFVGSVLAASGGPDLGGFMGSLPWLVLAGAVTVFRWVFTLNVLPAGGRLDSLWCLGGQMLWPCGAVGFELAFLSNYGAYRQLVHLPHPAEALGVVLGLASACGLQLFLELYVVQSAGLWALGLCAPLIQIASLAFSNDSGGLTLPIVVGLSLYGCVVAVEALAWAKDRNTESPSEGYQAMEDGYSKGRGSPQTVGSGWRPVQEPPVRSPFTATHLRPPQPRWS